MPDKITVAIDDGYAQIKLYAPKPDGSGIQKRLIRSSIRSGVKGLRSIAGGSSTIGAYKVVEGESFTVSDHVEGENTQFDGFHTSPMNRVLITHALAEAGYGGLDVELVAGLPVKQFFKRGGELNQALIDRKKENLGLGVERIQSAAPLARIDGIVIGCQAVSAWIDHMLDDDLKSKGDNKGRVAIVDVGGRTTDIAVVVNDAGTPIVDQNLSGTEEVGVLDVYTALSDALKAEFEITDEFPLALLDGTVRTGSIELFGETKDVSPLVAEAVAQVEGKIQRIIDRKLRGGATLKSIVFVGGGSALLTRLAEPFKNGKMADDPEFANARGLYKFRQMTRKRKPA